MPKNKMSAKTREEMNETKLLRETIRRLILENQSHYEKLAKLMLTAEKESIVQACELAEAMGYVSFTNHTTRRWNAGISNWWSCNDCNPQFLEEVEKQYMDDLLARDSLDYSINFYPEERLFRIYLSEYTE